jgi:Kef-type K+ transport system membrane component KefB
MGINQEDILDRQLREAAPYIDDDGFTACVLQRLPVSDRAARPSRAIILIGITILASLITFLLAGRFVNESIFRLANLPTLWVLALTFGAGLLLSLIGLVAAMSKSRELSF